MSEVAPVAGPTSVEAAHLGSRVLPAIGGATTPAPRPDQASRSVDQITIASPATARALWDLASSGLRQLGTLLPTLDRLLVDPHAEASPLGFLARALGDAAHSIDAGIASMSSGDPADHPSPAGFETWRQTATDTLHDASDLLGRAGQRLTPTAPGGPADAPRLLLRAALQGAESSSMQLAPNPLLLAAPTPMSASPDMLWAMSQVLGAQRQVGLALDSLSRRPSPVPPRNFATRRSPIDVRGAIAISGMALALLLVIVAIGVSTAAAGLGGAIIATTAALAWGWRVVVSSRDLRLELRHRQQPPQW